MRKHFEWRTVTTGKMKVSFGSLDAWFLSPFHQFGTCTHLRLDSAYGEVSDFASIVLKRKVGCAQGVLDHLLPIVAARIDLPGDACKACRVLNGCCRLAGESGSA